MALNSTPENVCGLAAFEDDAVVDWEAMRRVQNEMSHLREHWDLISLFDFSYYDRGLGRYYYTDRALRFGCIHRILPGKGFTVGTIYSRAGARRVLQGTVGQWDRAVVLGEASG